ncbi:phytanoyl-CoA dioxygenase family protein [Rhodobacteraceae bacterium 2CG4]|uniref:Phytanoyl-CoA dioxygenase family protein n=1 Tax=Halovulum marinum TaxID=2662447 RepID=A0A6L5YY07_9RHOB|nr:phytanoyl-CoA dioxygenase family protein [Halovulum marinum]MSU89201.1 phytanoyl-CoA dioxygenase family protein [Halovulum marinum]
MLTTDQIEFYTTQGYLLVEDVLTPAELGKMQDIARDLIDRSRQVTTSDDVYDLDEGHSPEQPKLTRIKLPHKQHPYFWNVLKNSRITEVMRQLLGANVLLQTSKLNTKAPGGGAAVEWHQDWAFYPHTNDDMLAFGVMLEDVTPENGPLQVIPGSHRGPILSHNNADGIFCGAVDPDDPEFHLDRAVTITGRAGSMSVHHARTLHGSAPNVSDRARLMLFYECCAADAWPLMGGSAYLQRLPQAEQWQDLLDRVVIGEPVLQPRLEQVPVRLPMPPAPDVSSIFQLQKSAGAKSAFAR